MVDSFLSREILMVETGSKRESLHNDVADVCVDSLLTCGSIGLDLLDDALAVVDDFGLTTRAAHLTDRDYWRKLSPTTGNRRCSCGRGKWATCQHWWAASAPEIRY